MKAKKTKKSKKKKKKKKLNPKKPKKLKKNRRQKAAAVQTPSCPLPEAPGRNIDLFLKGIRTAEADIPQTGKAHHRMRRASCADKRELHGVPDTRKANS